MSIIGLLSPENSKASHQFLATNLAQILALWLEGEEKDDFYLSILLYTQYKEEGKELEQQNREGRSNIVRSNSTLSNIERSLEESWKLIAEKEETWGKKRKATKKQWLEKQAKVNTKK